MDTNAVLQFPETAEGKVIANKIKIGGWGKSKIIVVADNSKRRPIGMMAPEIKNYLGSLLTAMAGEVKKLRIIFGDARMVAVEAGKADKGDGMIDLGENRGGIASFADNVIDMGQLLAVFGVTPLLVGDKEICGSNREPLRRNVLHKNVKGGPAPLPGNGGIRINCRGQADVF